MKKQFSVGFTIHEALNLVRERGRPIDPLVVVRCCGREYRSEIKFAKVNVVSWDESHTWTDIELTSDEWAKSFIEFEVQAANAFWRNTTIGLVALQLSLVQKRKTHKIKKSLPLQSPDGADLHGSLRVTVFACGPGESPPSPGEELEDSDDEDQGLIDDLRNVVIDNNQDLIRGEGCRPYNVYITIHRLEDVPPASKGLRDPFVVCEFAGCRVRTAQARATSSYTFNECFRIPVLTPVPEDTILVKVWDWNFMTADELLAVGRISFSELRSRHILPRWFNFYGFDVGEIPNFSEVIAQSGKLIPCTYMGRLLLSARAERLNKDAELLAAHSVAAAPYEDPRLIPILIFSDVYEVQGAPGDKVYVEVSCGPIKERTRWVAGDSVKKREREMGEAPSAVAAALEGAKGMANYFLGATPEGQDHFAFTPADGRVPELRMAVPDDEKQQWDVIISVYAKGISKNMPHPTRVSYQRMPLANVPLYVQNNPRAPVWVPLHPMPHLSGLQAPSAVLMTLEKAKSEAAARTKRKHVVAAEYLLRAYIYTARKISSPSGALPNPIVQVTCAGVTKETEPCEATSNPVFMECLHLELRLMTDTTTRLPTVVPIVTSLFDDRSWGRQLLGRAVCHYDRLRGKLKPGEIPSVAEPRWIKLKGGQRLNKHRGDILVCFELIRKKDAEVLPAYPMRPLVCMCRLTLSCLNLRDLILAPKGRLIDFDKIVREDFEGLRRVRNPVLLISVPSFGSVGRDRTSMTLQYERNADGDPSAPNRRWSNGPYESFDILKVAAIDVDIPEDPIFDPMLTIQVYDRKVKPKYFIGQFTLSLIPLMPWIADVEAALDDVRPSRDYEDSIDLKKIGGIMRGSKGKNRRGFSTANVVLEAISAADREVAEANQSHYLYHVGVLKYDPGAEGVASLWLYPDSLPKLLVQCYALPSDRPVLLASSMFSLNVFIPSKFVLCAEGKRAAEKKTKEQFQRPSVESTVETFLIDVDFPPDPLKKKAMGQTQLTGSVKFFVDLTHNGEPSQHVDQTVVPWALNESRLRKHFRGEEAYPKMIKIRVYVIRAINVHLVKGMTVANPYLVFSVGKTKMPFRAENKPGTLNPDFFTMWERDVAFPDESRLEISVWSAHEKLLQQVDDIFLGSTVIDLEQRWFSKEWQTFMKKNEVPMEYRPLTRRPHGNVTGSLEMWVEMMDSQKAARVPRFNLQKPSSTDIEIRVVLWGCRGLHFKHLGSKKETVDAVLRCTMDCTKYQGPQPLLQSTDVHYYSKTGTAIFNWRVVYSRVAAPVNSCILQISAYDFRNIGESPFIGEVNLEVRKYLERVAQTMASIEVDAELRLQNRAQETVDVQTFGYVQVTLQFMAQSEATSRPVGLGREPPNRDPRLTTPQEGRKWEDVLGSAGLRVDYRPIWYWVRVVFIVFLSLWLFVIAFLYPALFL
ncbi:C2 domain-containing protein, putative [Eimeria tenella]|uniref:C2 domain-containing protein, putative n=1 Tax=Eimeria tenella TaxID=5802 RepID=U6L1P6_EIMTE|nr:C2 domain-containing protein, putative [Eimeria tenella]CDJ42504.1 C2 domain-containing protein, putative [Eimeria tenella]|eukprot:XP_013233254.1 C2 domain-containing protein, putative [Eimeria tenella]